MQNEKYIQEDEIDLKELFKTIWNKKIFIVIFTSIITILSIVYVSLKIPIYEVKSVVKIGQIGDALIENSNILERKLRVIFSVDDMPFITEKYGIVSDISLVKKAENFIEITTQAFSNEKAIDINNEVVDFLQTDYKYKIDEYILRTNLNIKNLEEQIKYLEDVTKIQVNEKINFLKNVELVTIENKLNFNKEKMEQYQKNINDITKKRSSNDTQNMLSAMEILNYQNLILNLQNQIENLNKEKENILLEKIPNLNRELEYSIKNQLEDLNDKIELEKLKLMNNIATNSEIVGNILINDYPIKPRKSLIVVVGFVTGFILSIFLVFFINFINKIRKE
ncbi:Wzz/FepE/Etk N-terminal domain-containing protein [Aliarcobacter lanthieri]|uniref:Wzz/FepE/Etk N-terminal domain-containing protein n=1 Tax=Aliarcobacter lanthieri TaxID=1355374 RepID=UPI00047CE746|nr:Wzz/FepE/Etk N-terminal domain-containing protein [Aliarcobacter lanthieri]QKF58943.1 putative chain length determinant protein, Wzz family [Aliarcobacter lanthieri]